MMKTTSLGVLLVVWSVMNASSDGAEENCCGAKPKAAQQYRLFQATQSAMGLQPSTAMAALDGKALQRFNRQAAKFVMKESPDDALVAVRLFGDVITSRYSAADPATNFAWAPPAVNLPISKETFLADKGFVASASFLIGEIATGKIPYVIGGVQDNENKYPDCVAIGNLTRGFFCSGTLVKRNVVVTAHHCEPQSITHIFIGVTTPTPPVDSDNDSGHLYRVKEYRVHPDVGGSDVSGPPHDILVLVLEEDVKSEHATPREIATSDQVANARAAWIIGYGASRFEGTASGDGIRRVSPVPLIPGSLKSRDVARAFGCHYEFEFATGNLSGQASCFGDSGGPILIRDEATNTLRLAGAVSRALPIAIIGPESCGWGAVNTLVDKYRNLVDQ